MSSILSSQIETPVVNETAVSVVKEIASVLTVFAVFAVPTFLLALTWV